MVKEKKCRGRLEIAIREYEKSYIIEAIIQNGYNRIKTAKYLGIPISTFKYKMHSFGIYKHIKKLKRGSRCKQ